MTLSAKHRIDYLIFFSRTLHLEDEYIEQGLAKCMYKNVYSSVQTKSSSSAAIDDASSCSFASNIGKVIRKVIPQKRVNTFHTFHKLHRLDGRLKTHYAVC